MALMESIAVPDPFLPFTMQPLAPLEQEAYAVEWAAVQRRFVEDPRAAIGSADRLAGRILTDRGCPLSSLAGESCDDTPEPGLVRDYRSAHAIAQRDGHISYEDLGRAMSQYRLLFKELLPAGNIHAIDGHRGIAHGRAS